MRVPSGVPAVDPQRERTHEMNEVKQNPTPNTPAKGRFHVVKLEERIAPSNANFPPGQFPSGNPAHAPGRSNPNEVPASH